MRQTADRKPGNEIGQFIDKRLIERHPEWILCKQIAVSHENVALPHQAYGCAESCPLLCIWWQESPHKIDHGGKVRGCIGRYELPKDLCRMRAFPGEHSYVATHFILKKQRPQLVTHEAS